MAKTHSSQTPLSLSLSRSFALSDSTRRACTASPRQRREDRMSCCCCYGLNDGQQRALPFPLSLFLSASLHSVRWRHAPVSEDLHLRLLLLAPSLTATTTVAAASHSRCLFGTAVAVASGSGIVGRLSVGRWTSALSTALSCQGPWTTITTTTLTSSPDMAMCNLLSHFF